MIVIEKMSQFHIFICKEQLKKSSCSSVHHFFCRKHYNSIQKILCSVSHKGKFDPMQNVTMRRVSPYAECDIFQSLDFHIMRFHCVFDQMQSFTQCRVWPTANFDIQMQSVTKCRVDQLLNVNRTRVWPNAEYDKIKKSANLWGLKSCANC